MFEPTEPVAAILKPDGIYVFCKDGNVWKSPDGGDNWLRQTPIPGTAASPPPAPATNPDE
jgi:hypothetical protein